MALNFYQAYIRSMAVTPREEWSANYQAALDDFWDNTNTVTTVQAQSAVGSKEFADEQVQLTSTAIGNTGAHIGDFWRKLIHKNYAAATNYLGKYYIIDGEYWLTVNTNTVVGAVKDSVVRFCNQKLTWIDNSGVLHTWACVLEENKLTYTNPDVGTKDVPQVAADMVMLVQQNEETRSIPINQRFVFDGKAYQVKQINPHVSPTYLMIYLNATQLQEGDDTALNVANTIIAPVGTEIKILPQLWQLRQAKTQEYSVFNYVNGEPTADTFIISATYDPTHAIFTVIDGNHFSVTNIATTTEPVVVTCLLSSMKLATPTISVGDSTLEIDSTDFRAESFEIYADDEKVATIPCTVEPSGDVPSGDTSSTITITLGGAY